MYSPIVSLIYGEENIVCISVGSVALALLLTFYLLRFRIHKTSHPSGTNTGKDFLLNASAVLRTGLEKSDVFHFTSDTGPKTALGSSFIEKVSQSPDLSFPALFREEYPTTTKGFEPFTTLRKDGLLQRIIRVKVNQSLGSITKTLSCETAAALDTHWSETHDWREIYLKSTILRIIAALNSKVFLDEPVCRNPDWHRIYVEYTVQAFKATEELRPWPRFARPVVSLFYPSCRKIREHYAQARSIILAELKRRHEETDEYTRTEKTLPTYNDLFEWMDHIAKGRKYDPVAYQLAVAVAALHTTTDALTQVIFDLCRRDSLVGELREEAIGVLSSGTWSKTSLDRLVLMDSVLKESQRLKPFNIVALRRFAEEKFHLTTDITLAKGTSLVVGNDWMTDATVYEDPDTFDPYRFIKMRQIPGEEAGSQFVSPSPRHPGFGLGIHACPGRFFAAAELKVALCHILLKYDLKLMDGTIPKVRRYGFNNLSDPVCKILVRRRPEDPEIDRLVA